MSRASTRVQITLLILSTAMLLTPLFGETTAVTLLDRAEVLQAAASVTSEKFADADKVLIASYGKIRYNPDGTAVTLDDSYEKILTEKGRRENRVITLYFTLPYSRVSVLQLSLIKPDGQVVELDPEQNSREMVNPSQMSENIYNPNSRILQVSLPGLEVGDIIHAVTERQDMHPRMRDTWCGFFVFEHDFPIISSVVEIDAPKTRPLVNIMLKDSVGDTVSFSERADGDRVIYRWEARDVPQFFREPSMPPFYMYVQRLLVSTVRDWQDISRWYWQLCVPRLEKVSPEMKEKVAELTAGLETPEEKVQAIFHFVSTQIRYMGLTTETEAPGYEPSDVDLVFRNRYGVCRDKAALLVAMLRLADIEAWPVLFYVGPKKDPEVPNNFFNHAISCVELQPGEYILMDPTDENTAKLLPDYLADKSYVVAKPDGEELMTSPVIPAEDNLLEITTSGEVKDDLSLVASTSMRFDGINDTVYRGAFARWRPEERRQFFTRVLKYLAPGAELEKLRITPENLFDMTQALNVELEYRAPNWLIAENQNGLLQLPWAGTRFGVVNMVLRATGLRQRRFPLQMFSTCGVKDSFTLTLPQRYQLKKLPAYGAFSTPELDWRQEVKQDGNTVSGDMSFLIKTMEFSPEQYLVLKDTLKDIEFAKSKMPILAAASDPASVYPDANALILDEQVVVAVESANAWTERISVRKEILNYAGIKQNAELRFAYNPALAEVSLTEATVIAPDGDKKSISEREINIMDQSWVGAAPRYSPGRILVASLPGVKTGSVIEYTVETRYFDQPFVHGRYLFQGSEPIKSKSVSVAYPESLPLSWKTAYEGTRLSVKDSEHPTRAGYRLIRAEIADMPPIVVEPSVPPAWTFVPQLLVGGSDWKSYAGLLDVAFEKAIDSSAEAAALALSLASDATMDGGDKLEIVTKIRDYVATAVRDAGPAFSDLPPKALSSADRTLRDGYGHAADRAILLCAMLRAVGFDAEPLPVSTFPACLMQYATVPAPDFDNVLVMVKPKTSRLGQVFCKAENFGLDKLNYGLDFFVQADGRYEYRPRHERENTSIRNLPQGGCDLSSFVPHSSMAFDTSVSAASQNTAKSSKSSQSKRNFKLYRALGRIFGLFSSRNRVSVDGRNEFPVYLNDSSQYARIGTVARQHNWLLDLKQGRIREEFGENDNVLENSIESSYEIMLRENGAAKITRQTRNSGTYFESGNQRFAEMTPEKRSRFHQEIVAALSQAAEPVGPLVTKFEDYPGVEEFSVEIPTFAVREGSYLYWQLPGFPLENLFRTGQKERSNPFYLDRRLISRVAWVMHLPENTHSIGIMPTETPLRFSLPNGGGMIGISSEIGYAKGEGDKKRPATLGIVIDIDLQPTVVPVENYRLLEQINTAISNRLRQTVMIELNSSK